MSEISPAVEDSSWRSSLLSQDILRNSPSPITCLPPAPSPISTRTIESDWDTSTPNLSPANFDDARYDSASPFNMLLLDMNVESPENHKSNPGRLPSPNTLVQSLDSRSSHLLLDYSLSDIPSYVDCPGYTVLRAQPDLYQDLSRLLALHRKAQASEKEAKIRKRALVAQVELTDMCSAGEKIASTMDVAPVKLPSSSLVVIEVEKAEARATRKCEKERRREVAAIIALTPFRLHLHHVQITSDSMSMSCHDSLSVPQDDDTSLAINAEAVEEIPLEPTPGQTSGVNWEVYVDGGSQNLIGVWLKASEMGIMDKQHGAITRVSKQKMGCSATTTRASKMITPKNLKVLKTTEWCWVRKYEHVHAHQWQKHYKGLILPPELRLPRKSEIHSYLVILDADNPKLVPCKPIAPIQGIEIANEYKCMASDCHEAVFGSEVQVGDRVSAWVPCQPLSVFQKDLHYVKIIPELQRSSSALRSIVEAAEDCNLPRYSEVFTVASNEREKNAVFAQSRRGRLLVLVRHFIASSDPNDLKHKPFRRPQELKTIVKDSNRNAQFLAFLITTIDTPIALFLSILDSKHSWNLLCQNSRAKLPATPG
ncbi:hypothetical protein F5876DRAFT_68933 [Lentinula aff. lateritia]|uniref:Uncharacterized protein n=1 Tax=Lentinula aff. lateritia TaxID=2804960 RepID=A0ACC1TP59_9AGAR|nr:hypothetical protein F5876DRAFT_68933 [Lentinula aff. lateritia]